MVKVGDFLVGAAILSILAGVLIVLDMIGKVFV